MERSNHPIHRRHIRRVVEGVLITDHEHPVCDRNEIRQNETRSGPYEYRAMSIECDRLGRLALGRSDDAPREPFFGSEPVGVALEMDLHDIKWVPRIGST